MRVVRVRNVAEAWAGLPEVLSDAEEQDSRAGRVLACPEPVATVYSHPRERVLLDPVRDANPFFHLVEALWMLAGRDDAATLNHYVRDFGERFGEPDGRIHGAYGHRWRNALGIDQLDTIVSKLIKNPLDRQAVLQMWQAEDDTCADLEGDWRDRPCNTHAYFRVRPQAAPEQYEAAGCGPEAVLDMTVCCRSNDMVFGGYGANAVHFSMLQEYLAARIGVEVGAYTQISNNFHVYKDVWETKQPRSPYNGHYEKIPPLPMFTAPERIDADLEVFFHWHESVWAADGTDTSGNYSNNWFEIVAQPLVLAWFWRKKSLRDAFVQAQSIRARDWREGCLTWLQRKYA